MIRFRMEGICSSSTKVRSDRVRLVFVILVLLSRSRVDRRRRTSSSRCGVTGARSRGGRARGRRLGRDGGEAGKREARLHEYRGKVSPWTGRYSEIRILSIHGVCLAKLGRDGCASILKRGRRAMCLWELLFRRRLAERQGGGCDQRSSQQPSRDSMHCPARRCHRPPERRGPTLRTPTPANTVVSLSTQLIFLKMEPITEHARSRSALPGEVAESSRCTQDGGRHGLEDWLCLGTKEDHL